MRKSIGIFFLCILTFSACKTRKNSSSSNILDMPVVSDTELNKDTQKFWHIADSASQRFHLMNARFSATIIDAEGKEQSVKGKLKAARDSVLWISFTPFGLEIARIKADKENFALIDFFNKKYISGDYAYLKEFAGYDMDFYALQALVLGIHEFKANKMELHPGKNEDNWLIQEKGRLQGEVRVPDRKVWFSKSYVIPYRMEYSDWKTGDRVISEFTNFKSYNNVIFPSSILVEVKTEKKKFKAQIEMKGIDFEDPETEFWFQIPEGYQEIPHKR